MFACAIAEGMRDELVVFRAGTEHKTVYQQLTDEADEAWEDLYTRTCSFCGKLSILTLSFSQRLSS